MIRFALVEILPAAVLLLPVYAVLWKLYFRDAGKTVLYYILSVYLCAVYALVGLPNVTYIRFELSGNLIPFRDMLYGFRSSVQNVLLFIPLGVLLPLLWERYRKVKNAVFFGFCMSLIIELLQIFTYRATDINDLITNTAGTLIGWCLFAPLRKKIPAAAKGEKALVPVLVLSAACMFFLQPFLTALL